jgi:hypothetical protein
MQNDQAINPAPDWTTREKDLLCPLCGYNLRGLTESRCPECGFKFQWQELFDAEKDCESFLFEYGKGRNRQTFQQTFLRTWRARRFWNEVNPARPVKVYRLLIYWIIAGCICGCLLTAPTFLDLVLFIRHSAIERISPSKVSFNGAPGSVAPVYRLQQWYPLPWDDGFWNHFLSDLRSHHNGYAIDGPNEASIEGWGTIFLLWPWLTLISLQLFRYSMRQSKIRSVQLLRSVIYSCDFGVLFALGFIALNFYQPVWSDGVVLLFAALLCGLATTYRMSIAFRQYLRMPMPIATMVLSQLMIFMTVFLVLVELVDFSRRS